MVVMAIHFSFMRVHVEPPYAYMRAGTFRPLLLLFGNGKTYTDDMLRDPEALPNFYKMIDAGACRRRAAQRLSVRGFFDGLRRRAKCCTSRSAPA
jgi:hypothetical protein